MGGGAVVGWGLFRGAYSGPYPQTVESKEVIVRDSSLKYTLSGHTESFQPHAARAPNRLRVERKKGGNVI